jgi:hypothetical protein
MKTAQHTPGPWHAIAHPSGTFEILGDDTYPVLRIRGGMTPTNSNASLIAAAPDLLAALRYLVGADDDIQANRGNKSDQAMNRLAALDTAAQAIAKATGANTP